MFWVSAVGKLAIVCWLESAFINPCCGTSTSMDLYLIYKMVLASWSRDLLETLIVSEVLKRIPSFLGTQICITVHTLFRLWSHS
jgi:hypothetical protein